MLLQTLNQIYHVEAVLLLLPLIPTGVYFACTRERDVRKLSAHIRRHIRIKRLRGLDEDNYWTAEGTEQNSDKGAVGGGANAGGMHERLLAHDQLHVDEGHGGGGGGGGGSAPAPPLKPKQRAAPRHSHGSGGIN